MAYRKSKCCNFSLACSSDAVDFCSKCDRIIPAEEYYSSETPGSSKCCKAEIRTEYAWVGWCKCGKKEILVFHDRNIEIDKKPTGEEEITI